MDELFILVIAGTAGILIIVSLAVVVHSRNVNRLLRQRHAMAEAEALHREELANAFIRSQEIERRRIGMDLHDEVGTALSTLRMQWPAIAATDNVLLEDGSKMIDRVMTSIRRISHDLSPFIKGAYGLCEALEELGATLNRSGKIMAMIDISDWQDSEALSDETQLAVYRILSELVQNTLKHAHATSLTICFQKTAAALSISYTDNGIGLARPPSSMRPASGMGLANIESRLRLIGGSSRIDTSPQGFHIDLLIPVTT
jgi:signal transduction histidine kinase